MNDQLQTITLAGGCFWCLEAALRQVNGVKKAVSGYIAGQSLNPTYKQVCSGVTGHAEAVQVIFDPTVLPLAELLAIFFTIHDPTTLNRQGNDIGTQYRSGVFFDHRDQVAVIKGVISKMEAAKYWTKPVVTEITPASTFYPAEDYHQDYYAKNPNQPYCMVVVAEKVAKVRKMFAKQVSA